MCGDDWQWLGVRRAVVAFAAETGLGVASHRKENWWLLESKLLEPLRDRWLEPASPAAPLGGPEPKRARVVEFTSAGRA